jgi:hypothetical protein
LPELAATPQESAPPAHEKAPTESAGAESNGDGYKEAVAALKIAVEAKEQARLAEAEAKEAYKKMLAMKEEQSQYLAASFVERDEFEGIAAALGGLIVASRKGAKQLKAAGLVDVDVDKEMKVFLDRPRRGTLSGVGK